MAQRDLKNVVKALRKVRVAEEQLTAAILAAHRSGETFRDIGVAASLSTSRIHQIVRDNEPAGDAQA